MVNEMADTIVRSIAIPVQGPVDSEWSDVSEHLRQAWSMSTALANWGVTELLKRDPGRHVKDEKLCKMPSVALYNIAFVQKRFADWRLWGGACSSAASILHRVSLKYSKERLAVQWKRERHPSSYRYPYPWPIHNAAWKVYRDTENGRRTPCISLLLPGGRVTLALRAGAEFARQLRTFDMIIGGSAAQGEASITRQLVHCDRGGRTLFDREAGGAAKQQFREIVRLAVKLPKPEGKGMDGSMVLSTDMNAFWVGQIDGRVERPWILNADHVRRREARHACFLQRIGEDFKPEKRWPHGVRRQMNEHRAARCDKHNRFISTWTQQAAAMVRSYCQRNGIGYVAYDDSCHDYCRGFPWYRQRLALQNCLEAVGIEVALREDQDEAVA
jgi:hypothetical protein